jgi:hypothetical protein
MESSAVSAYNKTIINLISNKYFNDAVGAGDVAGGAGVMLVVLLVLLVLLLVV